VEDRKAGQQVHFYIVSGDSGKIVLRVEFDHLVKQFHQDVAVVGKGGVPCGCPGVPDIGIDFQVVDVAGREIQGFDVFGDERKPGVLRPGFGRGVGSANGLAELAVVVIDQIVTFARIGQDVVFEADFQFDLLCWVNGISRRSRRKNADPRRKK